MITRSGFGSPSPQSTFGQKFFSREKERVSLEKWEPHKRGMLAGAGRPGGPAASDSQHPVPRPPALPAPSSHVPRAPSRSPPFAAACRWVPPSCRSPSRKAARLPCHQPPAPSSRSAQGQESASGGRGAGLTAEPAAPLQVRESGTRAKLTAGRRVPSTPGSSLT